MTKNTAKLKNTERKKSASKKRTARAAPVKRAGRKVAGPRMVEIEIEISESAEAVLREIAALANQSFDTVVSVFLAAEVVRTKTR